MTSEERFLEIEKLLRQAAEQVVIHQQQLNENNRAFETRFDRLEKESEERGRQIDKVNDASRSLIVVARTVLDSIREDRVRHERDYEEMRAQSKATEEKLNILVDTVDRIIRDRDNK